MTSSRSESDPALRAQVPGAYVNDFLLTLPVSDERTRAIVDLNRLVSDTNTALRAALAATEAAPPSGFPLGDARLVGTKIAVGAAAEAASLDAFILGMAMDQTDELDSQRGVIGRGTKAERVAIRYADLAALPSPDTETAERTVIDPLVTEGNDMGGDWGTETAGEAG